jgi:RNA polymerase sigma-70 factor (ECF subfamily)
MPPASHLEIAAGNSVGSSEEPKQPDELPTRTLEALAREIDTILAAARPRLLHLARLHGLSPETAEDVAQEVSLVVWRSLDHLRAPDRFDAWLDGIARNISRRYLRAERAARHRTTALPRGSSSADSDGDPGGAMPNSSVALGIALRSGETAPGDLDEELTHQDLVALLDRALGYLTPNARAAVERCYLAEQSAREAARQLGLTITALETRLSRARQELRHILSGPLRDEAAAFDLAVDHDDVQGWRQTRLWCHQCAKRRLIGLVQETPAGPEFTMRCPDCWHRYGSLELHYEPHPLLRGVRSFRPAFKRFVQQVVPLAVQALRAPLACPVCGAPARSRLLQGDEIAELVATRAHHPAFTYLMLECSICGPGLASPSAIVGSVDPLVRQFMLNRSRWIVECNERAFFACSPALHSRLVDYESGARLTFFNHPETLEVLATFAE